MLGHRLSEIHRLLVVKRLEKTQELVITNIDSIDDSFESNWSSNFLGLTTRPEYASSKLEVRSIFYRRFVSLPSSLRDLVFEA